MKADHINSTQKQYNIVEGKYNNVLLQKSMVRKHYLSSSHSSITLLTLINSWKMKHSPLKRNLNPSLNIFDFIHHFSELHQPLYQMTPMSALPFIFTLGTIHTNMSF